MSKGVRILASLIAVGCLFAGLYLYKYYISGPSVPKDLDESQSVVQIPTNSSFEEVVELLKEQGFIKEEKTFRWLSEKMNYKRNPMRSGRYQVEPGWSAVELIRHLRGGKQAPVNVIFTNERLLEDVASKAARFLEPDSTDFMTLFNDQRYLEEIGYTQETLMSLCHSNLLTSKN